MQQHHIGRRPPRLSTVAVGVPSDVEEIVHRSLAKDRQERFESAAALREALERALAAAPRDAAAVRSPAASAPAAEVRSRRPTPNRGHSTMSLLFFEADVNVVTIKAALGPLGGQLAHATGGRYVIAFGHDLGENPARQARHAAHELCRRGLAGRVRLDVGAVTVLLRPDGSRRYVSPLFTRPDRFPTVVDPPGVTVTDAARDLLGDVADSPSSTGTTTGDTPAPTSLVADVSLSQGLSGGPTSGAAVSAGVPPDVPSDLFLGRDAEVGALLASARRAVTEPVPTVMSVIAGAGHGKSRLGSVLGKRLRQMDLGEVIDLRAHEPTLGGADRTLRELLQRAFDLPDAAPPDGGRALLGERLGGLGATDAAPAVAVALGWATAGDGGSPMESGIRALDAAPGALRSALTAAVGEALRRRAGARPVLLLLDDAHHADHATIAALEDAALAEARAPLWICALGRPAFAEEHPAWGERAGHRASLRLGPLDPASAAELCRRLLLPAEDVPDPAVRGIVERAQAIPLLLVELVRGLRRAGAVRKRPALDSYYLATDELNRLPDLPLVEWLAQGELDALPETLKAHARLAALLGEEVSIEDLAGVLRMLEERGAGAESPLDAKVGTRRLISAGLVHRNPQGGLVFRHALVREAIAKSVPAPLRRLIHEAATKHHSVQGASDDRRLALLAHHAAEAGAASIAKAAYLDLAERMRARHAYVEAERCYSRAVEQLAGEADPRRLSALQGRGLMRYRVGRYHDALADFAVARTIAREAGDVAAEVEILLDEATALDWTYDYKSFHRAHRGGAGDPRDPGLAAARGAAAPRGR